MRFDVVNPMPEIRVRLPHSRRAYLRCLSEHDAGADEAGELSESADAVCSSFDAKGVGLCHLVYMRPDLDRPAGEDAGLLAHEATHVMQGYLDSISEGDPSDELAAYIVGAVTTQLVSQHFAWKQRRIDKRDGAGR